MIRRLGGVKARLFRPLCERKQVAGCELLMGRVIADVDHDPLTWINRDVVPEPDKTAHVPVK
jgi:hypothetical protein